MVLFLPRRTLVTPGGFQKPAQPVLDTTHPINVGLLGAWLLGDTVSGNAPDLTNFSYGTPTAITQANSHHGGQSYAFNGSTSAISVAANPAFNFALNDSITIAGWTNLIFGGGGTIIDHVLSTNRNFSLNNGNTDFTFTYGSSGFNQFRTSGSVQQYSAWHHLAVTFTYGANNIVMYLDGQSVAGGWISGGGSNTPDSVTTAANIGGSSALNNAFHGSLEGIRLWKRYLSASEIAWLYAEPYLGIQDGQEDFWFFPAIASAVVASGATKLMMGI